MVAIAKSGTPVVSTASPGFEHNQAGRYAAEAIAAGDIVTINSSGLVAKWTTGTKYRGVAAGAASAGEPITIYAGVNFHYGSGLTPGSEVYVTTGGGIDTAGTVAVGFVVDSTRIFFYNVYPHA